MYLSDKGLNQWHANGNFSVHRRQGPFETSSRRPWARTDARQGSGQTRGGAREGGGGPCARSPGGRLEAKMEAGIR